MRAWVERAREGLAEVPAEQRGAAVRQLAAMVGAMPAGRARDAVLREARDVGSIAAVKADAARGNRGVDVPPYQG
ncbi:MULTISPECIES: hypothetical protein [unclassified Streptomyces]|uniref:hypothetical protein n=1 Tax=unclassified Streptomyces TaxID=2593676 RepID=UPI00081D6169|nr:MULTISPECIES: hypothetical protein [unclassified Streptomyces]MYR30342.1 hypothetical protein [Streptomyces sp. SID4945]SCF49477.1 hypothetical protein GA0115257_12255 [Streptomyces sp. LcepLS]